MTFTAQIELPQSMRVLPRPHHVDSFVFPRNKRFWRVATRFANRTWTNLSLVQLAGVLDWQYVKLRTRPSPGLELRNRPEDTLGILADRGTRAPLGARDTGSDELTSGMRCQVAFIFYQKQNAPMGEYALGDSNRWINLKFLVYE